MLFGTGAFRLPFVHDAFSIHYRTNLVSHHILYILRIYPVKFKLMLPQMGQMKRIDSPAED